jgi:hypothetical protein
MILRNAILSYQFVRHIIIVNQRFDLRIFSKSKELFRDINDPELKRELADGQTQLISNIEIE